MQRIFCDFARLNVSSQHGGHLRKLLETNNPCTGRTEAGWSTFRKLTRSLCDRCAIWKLLAASTECVDTFGPSPKFMQKTSFMYHHVRLANARYFLGKKIAQTFVSILTGHFWSDESTHRPFLTLTTWNYSSCMFCGLGAGEARAKDCMFVDEFWHELRVHITGLAYGGFGNHLLPIFDPDFCHNQRYRKKVTCHTSIEKLYVDNMNHKCKWHASLCSHSFPSRLILPYPGK